MTAYADTGFLCSLYAPDAHTARAVARMRRQTLPLPWTWLHELELRNVLRLRVFRREITAVQSEASLNAQLSDLASGFFAIAAPELSVRKDTSRRIGNGRRCFITGPNRELRQQGHERLS